MTCVVFFCDVRFGEGYTLSLRVKGPDFEEDMLSVKQFIGRNFPEALLKVCTSYSRPPNNSYSVLTRCVTSSLFWQECHHNMTQYELPGTNVRLADVFRLMEDAQQSLNIEDYSVSQNTLDNVSLREKHSLSSPNILQPHLNFFKLCLPFHRCSSTS